MNSSVHACVNAEMNAMGLCHFIPVAIGIRNSKFGVRYSILSIIGRKGDKSKKPLI
jgi:hypothetical protein